MGAPLIYKKHHRKQEVGWENSYCCNSESRIQKQFKWNWFKLNSQSQKWKLADTALDHWAHSLEKNDHFQFMKTIRTEHTHKEKR